MIEVDSPAFPNKQQSVDDVGQWHDTLGRSRFFHCEFFQTLRILQADEGACHSVSKAAHIALWVLSSKQGPGQSENGAV
ncbi:hypothetical protein ABMB68_009581 [Bradyrhizobium sp. RT4a]|uniref:hypothetical protein n=1 Tax=unclassified Bradyrhizobium TaxID=2631580 RepID=UPI00339A71EB